MTSMNLATLPYDHVTNSFLLEIWFCGPTYPTFLFDVTIFTLLFEVFTLIRTKRVNGQQYLLCFNMFYRQTLTFGNYGTPGTYVQDQSPIIIINHH